MAGHGAGLHGQIPHGGGGASQEEATPISLSSVEILSLDSILLSFNKAVVNDSTLQSVNSYTIVPVSSGIAVTIRSISTGNSEFVTQVVMYVTPPTRKEEYSVDVVGDIRGVDASELDPSRSPVVFEARSTKMDSVLSRITEPYATEPGSNLRSIFHAITREDDKIGGSREDFLE